MSEQSQGPGWWEASDGKWYPPEQAPVNDPTTPEAAGPLGPAAGTSLPPAAGGGGSNLPKIIAGVIAVVLIAGVAAFALTRDSDSDSGGSVKAFCEKAKALHNDIDLDQGFEDAATAEKVVNAFSEVNKAAPAEIKADMNLLNDALRKAAQAVKDGKSTRDAFTEEEGGTLDAAGANVEKFGQEKCPEGPDFLLSSSSIDSDSSDSSDSSSSSRSSSSRSSSSSTSAADGVTDAVATRDELIAIALQPGAVDASGEGAVPAWKDAFPGVGFTGSGNLATPTKVSGFAAVYSKAKDVGYLAFAVLDIEGQCSGGVLEFDDAGTSVTNAIVIGDAQECSGSSVAEAAGY